jgi:glycosyltransferase involved in cell wall biosynthesis
VPFVALVHQAPGGDERSASRRVRELRTYRAAAAVIATGPGPAADLEASGLMSTVVVPGTDLPPDDVVPAVGLRGGRAAAVLCVANWLPSKGIADLLRAVARLDPGLVTLHLVGDPSVDPAYTDEVLRLARSDELRRRVVLHGVVPPAGVAALLAGADVFALPSLQEAYGMAWAEAMAAGLPVVGWRTSNLPNLVSHRVEGLLASPEDLDGLAAALASLAADPAARTAMGDAARRRAARFPTWAQTTARIVGIVRAVAGQPAPA